MPANNDRDAAYRVGYIAGLGLRCAKNSSVSSPFGDMHTTWSNFVPRWVDEAQLVTVWRDGFSVGIGDGVVNSHSECLLLAKEN